MILAYSGFSHFVKLALIQSGEPENSCRDSLIVTASLWFGLAAQLLRQRSRIRQTHLEAASL